MLSFRSTHCIINIVKTLKKQLNYFTYVFSLKTVDGRDEVVPGDGLGDVLEDPSLDCTS